MYNFCRSCYSLFHNNKVSYHDRRSEVASKPSSLRGPFTNDVRNLPLSLSLSHSCNLPLQTPLTVMLHLQ